MRSNVKDLLGFINTVIVTPETLNLTKESVASLTTPIVVPLLSNGTKNGNFTDGEGFAKGVSAFGSPGEPHGVSLPPFLSFSTKFWRLWSRCFSMKLSMPMSGMVRALQRRERLQVPGRAPWADPAGLLAISDFTLQRLPGTQTACKAPAPAFPI